MSNCYFCDASTCLDIESFYLIGWEAFKIGNMRIICYCEKDINLGRELMKEKLIQGEVNNDE